MKKYCVNSLTRTGSTLVVNIVSELLNPGKPISTLPDISLKQFLKASPGCNVCKLHVISEIDRNRDVNFIVPIRPGLKPTKDEPHDGTIPVKYHDFDNVLIIYYNDLLYKSTRNPDSSLSEEDVVQNIASNMEKKFNINISDENKVLAVQRVKNMDRRYEDIKDQSFHVYDEYYHIHGNHRDRRSGIVL